MNRALDPRAEQQLIQLSAGIASRRESMRERAVMLMGEVDWLRLAEMLRRRKLFTVLGPRILELGGDSVDKDFSASVAQGIQEGRRRGASLQLVSLRIIDMLAAEGIRSTALKGPLLGEAIYGDPGRRVSSDIDLLVSPEQLCAAVDVVRELGYSPPTDYVDANGLPLLHFALGHARGELPSVEIHWRIHWYERTFARERLLPPAPEFQRGWRPAPAAELGALLLFYARDGFAGLRLASDLSGWWDSYGASFSRGSLEEILRTYPALARAFSVALHVAERTVGLPTEQIIGHTPTLSLRERTAVRLANPNPQSSRAQLFADIGLIDGLLSPPGGLGAFLRRQVLPPPQVLDQQARLAARAHPRSRLGRGAGVLGRYGLTMTRLLRTPETLR